MIKRAIHKKCLAVVTIIALLIVPIRELPDAQAEPQILGAILRFAARHLLVTAVKKLIVYTITNADSWNLTEASNTVLTGMTRPIKGQPGEAESAFKPIAQDVTNAVGQQTDSELPYQIANEFELDVENVLQDLGIDPEALPWKFEKIVDTGGILSAIDVDRNGFPHIVYKDNLKRDDVRYALWDGSSWKAVVISRSGYEYDEGDIDIKIDTQGNAHIVYSGWPKGLATIDRRTSIWYAVWKGTTRVSEQEIDKGFFIPDVSIDLDGRDYPHIVYSYLDIAGSAYTKPTLRYATWNGTKWENEVVTLFKPDLSSRSPSIVIDQNNVPHVIFWDGRVLLYAKRDPRFPRGRETIIGFSEEDISLALDRNGFPHINYYDPKDRQVKYVRLEGNEWVYQDVKAHGQLALDDNDVAYILEEQFDMDLKISRWDGKNWQELLVNNPEPLNLEIESVSRSFALDDKGYAHMSYNPRDGGLIYVRSNFDVRQPPAESLLVETESPPMDNFPWDVNRDGVVDIIDIVLVGQSFGQKKLENTRVDVNKDGVVDIVDITLIGQHFGQSTTSAAPQLVTRERQSIEILQRVYQELLQTPIKPKGYLQTKSLLEHILRSITPGQTRLLANYPNPFNPETWIPYQLAKTSQVVIRIYDLSGKLVKTLDLGNREAGYYLTTSLAAYWNGSNEFGQKVSSGVYFYTIQADDFVETKKMVLLK